MKNLFLTGFASWLLLVSISLISYAQSENYRFEHLSTQQGLSQNFVWSIHQDQEGFMWFGTNDGLNKYDGYSFTVLKPDPDDPENTLHHNIITDIHEDREGRLWVATLGGGLHQVDKHTGKVTRYSVEPSHVLRWNVISTIYEDQEGIFWLGAFGGVARFNPNTKQFTLFSSPNKFLSGVAQDADGRYWAGGDGGIYRLDTNARQLVPVLLDSSLAQQPLCNALYLDSEGILWMGTQGEGLFRSDTIHGSGHFIRYNPSGVISQFILLNGIYEDRKGYLWLLGSDGLQRVTKNTDKVLSFQSNPFQPGSLSHHNASAIYQDRNGTLWVGTDHGINKVTSQPKQFRVYQPIPSLPSIVRHQNDINTLLEDHTGMIWLGSAAVLSQGNLQNGLFRFDPETQQFEHFPADPSNPDSLMSNMVLSVYEDRQQRLWVGTVEALHLFDRITGKFTRYPSEIAVDNLVEDVFGNLWCGSWGVGIERGIATFNPVQRQFKYYFHDYQTHDPSDTTGLRDGAVWDIAASRAGDIWVALSGAGIARLDLQTNTFTNYFPSNSSLNLNDKDVRTIYEDSNGIIWAGTNQGGLHRYDSLTDTFTYYTMHDGLPTNHIESIIEDKRGYLWMGTNQGLSRFNPKTETFLNFDISDGLPANQFRGGSVYSRNGKLMFGSINGFVIFDPDSIQKNTFIPPVYITKFHVMEEEREVPTSNIELPYDQNFLSFDFVALNYDSPEKNQYAYQLEGVDQDWIHSGNRRFASYPDLDPGKYTFRVIGSNNDGLWNEEGKSLNITILPPWWQTRWAYTLYGMLAIGFLYGLRHYTVKRERLKHELKLQTLEAEKMHELDHLKSRFFANISHEFRTPLTLILGPLEKFLSRTSEASEDQRVYQMMQRNAQRLLHLINQLLDLSKLEAGCLTLETKPAAIVPFLKAMALSFTSLAERQQIQYHVRYPGGQPVVYFDADKLEKIITNLLSNAFKFTPEGGTITVTVKLHPTQEKSDLSIHRKADLPLRTLELKVQDSGMGLSEALTQRVFDRFYQVDVSQNGEQQGSGIGLSLVRELVELHGGEVSVESQPGQGTCFTVGLPVVMADYEEVVVGEPILTDNNPNTKAFVNPAEDEMNEPSEAVPEEANSDTPLVLIVEDNADVRAFIRDTLQPAYQVLEAADGVAGYERAVETIPDLILSDVMMPKMDGVELCGKLKADEKTAHVPVILLTAKASGGDKIEGLETGADDYIIKPFQADELRVRIKNLIDSRKKLREHFSREITLQPASIQITSADEKFLQRVMQIVEEYMGDDVFGVEALGQEVGMSRAQLFRKLKALTNHAPGDLIRIIRLKRAADLLSQGAGNIADIAYQVGFSSPSYFTKCFHKQFGQTPSDYMASTLS